MSHPDGALRATGVRHIYLILLSHISHSTRLLAATTLRNVLGTKNLAEILSERETISQVMQNSLDEATDPWGVKVRSNVALGPTTPS